MMKHRFGARSLDEAKGVSNRLLLLSSFSLLKSPVDFGIYDGMRTLEEQEEYVRTGVSRTLESKHLTGEAVDLVPFINGKYRWELESCCHIAKCMAMGSVYFGIPVIWGAVWDRKLTDLNHNDLLKEVEEYTARRKAAGHKAFIDAVHFELGV